jgi:hypothetical protein
VEGKLAPQHILHLTVHPPHRRGQLAVITDFQEVGGQCAFRGPTRDTPKLVMCNG